MLFLPQSLPDVAAISCSRSHGKCRTCWRRISLRCLMTDTYAVGFVVRTEDKDAEWATGLAKAVQCDALADYYKTEKKGTMIPCGS